MSGGMESAEIVGAQVQVDEIAQAVHLGPGNGVC